MKTTIFYLIICLFTIQISIAQEGKIKITTSSEKALELYLKARNFSERVQPLSAQPLYEEALKLDPNFVFAKFGLANTYGQPGARRKAFQELFAMLPNAKLSEGEKLFFDRLQAGFNGDQQTANKKLFEQYEKFPNDERIVTSMAGYYAGQNDIPKAIELYEKAIKINPNYVPVYNTLGYTYRGQGKMDDAERIFKQAIQIDQENPNGYDSYAELLLKLGRYEESIKNYDEALKREQIFPSAVMGIASNLLHLKRYDEARKRLNHIMDIAPNDGIRGGVCWALAVTHVDEGNFDKAIKEMTNNYNYSKKAKDYQSMAIDLGNIMTIYILKGDYKMAEKKNNESLASFLKTDFTDQQKENIKKNNLYTQIRLAAKLGRFEEAETKLEEYKAFAKSQPNNRFLPNNIHELNSIIAFEKGNYPKTIEELDMASRSTWSYDNMYRRALAYQKLGETDKAKEWFTHIVTSRGALNFRYSVMRHKAQEQLASL